MACTCAPTWKRSTSTVRRGSREGSKEAPMPNSTEAMTGEASPERYGCSAAAARLIDQQQRHHADRSGTTADHARHGRASHRDCVGPPAIEGSSGPHCARQQVQLLEPSIRYPCDGRSRNRRSQDMSSRRVITRASKPQRVKRRASPCDAGTSSHRRSTFRHHAPR